VIGSKKHRGVAEPLRHYCRSAEIIQGRCPDCEIDSIIGHGRHRKRAHHEYHDWIDIGLGLGLGRGRRPGCRKTFTFLPLLSPPYTRYSLQFAGALSGFAAALSLTSRGKTAPWASVNARKNLFYCHGRGQGGDLIRFVQL
jgi:hypothetical protein